MCKTGILHKTFALNISIPCVQEKEIVTSWETVARYLCNCGSHCGSSCYLGFGGGYLVFGNVKSC